MQSREANSTRGADVIGFGVAVDFEVDRGCEANAEAGELDQAAEDAAPGGEPFARDAGDERPTGRVPMGDPFTVTWLSKRMSFFKNILRDFEAAFYGHFGSLDPDDRGNLDAKSGNEFRHVRARLRQGVAVDVVVTDDFRRRGWRTRSSAARPAEAGVEERRLHNQR